MIAIRAKRICPVTQPPIDGGTVLVENGKIAAVGRDLPLPPGTQLRDFPDAVVTPGLIEAHAHLGQFGIQDLPEGNDLSSPVCPQMRILDGVNPRARAFARTRSAGFTTVCLLPGSANIIGGTGAVVKLRNALSADELAYGPPQLKMALGENPRRTYGEDRGRSPMTRMGNAAVLREALRAASAYARAAERGEKVPFDARWEAMRPAFSGEARIHVHCHRMDDILTAVRLLEPYGVRFSIDHATEGHLVAETLAKKGVPCIVGPIACGPQKNETWNCTPRCAALLERAGVRDLAITSDGDLQVCYLPIDVGICMAYGLTEETAFRALTIGAAKILGVDGRTGSLEVGKDADLAVFDGFPFSNATLCRGVFIDGVFYESTEVY